jgi:hypothetical protein
MGAALVVTEYGNKAPDTFVLYRGNPHAETSPELLVEPAFPSVLKAVAPIIEPPENGRSTGRRLALAKWIVSAENPLSRTCSCQPDMAVSLWSRDCPKPQ